MTAIARELDYPDQGAQSRLDSIKGYVDGVEALLAQIRDGVGGTGTTEQVDDLITKMEQVHSAIVAAEAARDTDATTAQTRLNLLSTEATLQSILAELQQAETADASLFAKMEQVRAAIASAETARDADATSAQTRLNLLSTEATLYAVLVELQQKLEAGQEVALTPATLAALENITVTVASLPETGLAKDNTLGEVRDRIGSYGVGVPAEGTVTSLLRAIHAAVDGLEFNTDNVALNADQIQLNTDQVENLLTDIGGALGTTADPNTDDTLIGRTKQIVAQLTTLNGAAATAANQATANELLDDLKASLADIYARLADGNQRTRIVDSTGALITDANPLPVDLTIGATINAEFQSVISTANQPPDTIAANSEWVGEYEDLRDYAAIVGIALSTGALTLEAQFTEDTTEGTPIFTTTQTIPANIAGRFIFARSARYFRVRIINNNASAVTVRGELGYTFNPPTHAQLASGAQTNDLNLSALVQSHLKARHSTGNWYPLNIDATAQKLLTLDSEVRDRIGATTAPADGTLLARLELIRALLDGTLDVNVGNFPATQPISAAALPLPADAATQTTLAAIETLLTIEDFASETTLAAIETLLTTEDFASQTTLAAIETLLTTEDFASETTLAAVNTKLQTLLDRTPALTLTARMLDKKPQTGYELWLDPDNTFTVGGVATAGLVLAEAPTAQSDLTAAVWSGIFVPSGAGRMVERTNFAWNSRTVGW